MQAIVSIIREIVRDNNMMAQHILLLLTPENSIVDNPVYLCDFVGTIAQNAETEELQAIMDEMNVRLNFCILMVIIFFVCRY